MGCTIFSFKKERGQKGGGNAGRGIKKGEFPRNMQNKRPIKIWHRGKGIEKQKRVGPTIILNNQSKRFTETFKCW